MVLKHFGLNYMDYRLKNSRSIENSSVRPQPSGPSVGVTKSVTFTLTLTLTGLYIVYNWCSLLSSSSIIVNNIIVIIIIVIIIVKTI